MMKILELKLNKKRSKTIMFLISLIFSFNFINIIKTLKLSF